MAQIINQHIVRFARGKRENLPEGVQRIEMYMKPGDDTIYIVDAEDWGIEFPIYEFKNGKFLKIYNEFEK